MTIWEIVKYGLMILGISFILWMAAYQTTRFLKNKGILKTRKINLKPWEKKEPKENEKDKLDNSL